MKGVMADLVASGIKAAIAGFKNLVNVAKEAYEEFDKGADAVIKATGATGSRKGTWKGTTSGAYCSW